MIRDYMIVSPSLDGVLSHDSIVFEGINRPNEILQVLDGPASRGKEKLNKTGRPSSFEPLKQSEIIVLEQYLHDLYGLFMKKLSQFVLASEVNAQDVVQLQALFQEIIKVKQLRNRT